MSGLPRPLALAAVFAVLLAWPFASPNDYVTALGVTFLIHVGLVAGLNLVAGHCGQVSLCHATFFGLGAYAAGMLAARYGWTPAAGLPAAVLLSALGAALIGVPALRLHGHYLAMATLGFAAIVSVLFNELVSLTGGPNGLLGVSGFSRDFDSPVDTPLGHYLIAWAYAGLSMWLVLRLLASRTGRAMRAITFSELAAGGLGVDTARVKITVFVLSAAMAGAGGWVYVHANQFASPETFGFHRSVLLLTAVAIGGWGRYWAPLPGALVLTMTPEVLGRLHDFEMLIFGGALVLVLLAYPGGLSALSAAMWDRVLRPFRRRRRRGIEGDAAASPKTARA
ncbi:MAG TPA: branched-chain amino acid ABC transporter permease [Crenalkalicoccus sp.]|jgi:branched-chain amino acid transport system permease protein|nr:branched-chain amino acid ABC transporter permease [Crenalkalicoccus sp.]